MIVLRCVVDLEDNCNLRIEEFDVERREIRFCIEDEAVGAARQRLFNQKEGFYATVFVRPGMTEFGPAFVCVLRFEIDLHTTRRSAA